MSENKKMTKREFLTHLAVVSGATVVAAQMLGVPALAQEKRRGAKKEDAPKKDDKPIDWPLVEVGKGTAGALAYHHTHEEASKDPKTDKTTDKGTPWEKRFCSSCSFYW